MSSVSLLFLVRGFCVSRIENPSGAHWTTIKDNESRKFFDQVNTFNCEMKQRAASPSLSLFKSENFQGSISQQIRHGFSLDCLPIVP
jgi:hypothetical protein